MKDNITTEDLSIVFECLYRNKDRTKYLYLKFSPMTKEIIYQVFSTLNDTHEDCKDLDTAIAFYNNL